MILFSVLDKVFQTVNFTGVSFCLYRFYSAETVKREITFFIKYFKITTTKTSTNMFHLDKIDTEQLKLQETYFEPAFLQEQVD